MTITAITPQVRRAGRYSIFIDGEFGFGIAEEQLANLGLHQNKSVTEEELRAIERVIEFDSVKRSALRSLELRMNSESELRQKLLRKEFDPGQVDDVMAWLSARDLINDAVFAQRWIETRRDLQHLGEYRLKQELRKKGIGTEVIDEALAEQTESEEDQVRRAAHWASRRYAAQVAMLDEQSVKVKVMSAIVRRGFSYPIAKQAVEQISAERDG